MIQKKYFFMKKYKNFEICRFTFRKQHKKKKCKSKAFLLKLRHAYVVVNIYLFSKFKDA